MQGDLPHQTKQTCNLLKSSSTCNVMFQDALDVAVVENVVQLHIPESKVGKINVHFQDNKTGEVKEGKTKPDIIMRSLGTKPGQVRVLPCRPQKAWDFTFGCHLQQQQL